MSAQKLYDCVHSDCLLDDRLMLGVKVGDRIQLVILG